MYLTAGVLDDCKRMKLATAESTNKGTYFIAEALSIFTWQIMTDVWGDIPYFEALKADEGIISPKFDEGRLIYADLLERVNELLKTDLDGSLVDGKYDLIYAGDLNYWKAFANSLILKLALEPRCSFSPLTA